MTITQALSHDQFTIKEIPINRGLKGVPGTLLSCFRIIYFVVTHGIGREEHCSGVCKTVIQKPLCGNSFLYFDCNSDFNRLSYACVILALIKGAFMWTGKPRDLWGLWLPGETCNLVAPYFYVFPSCLLPPNRTTRTFPLSPLVLRVQSRKYYFLSEEVDEKEDLSQRCRDLEHQVGSTCLYKHLLKAQSGKAWRVLSQ